MRPLLLTLAVTAIALAPVAGAGTECETEERAITVGSGDATFHLFVDDCTLDGTCIVSVWLFQESNGEPGLQRDSDPETDCEGDTFAY